VTHAHLAQPPPPPALPLPAPPRTSVGGGGGGGISEGGNDPYPDRGGLASPPTDSGWVARPSSHTAPGMRPPSWEVLSGSDSSVLRAVVVDPSLLFVPNRAP